MKTYLLFDSGCATCSKLAQAIQREVDGALTARSLRDPEMQELLVRTDPEWEWEPTLLEIREEAVRAYTGIRLGLRLIRTLGPRKALRIMKLVGRHAEELQGKIGPADPGRRRWLRHSGSVLAAIPVLLALNQPGIPQKKRRRRAGQTAPETGSDASQARKNEQQAEIWNGFALLPAWDSSVPESVQPVQAPIMGKAVGENVDQLRPDIRHFNTVEELADDLPASLSYPTQFPWDVRLTTAETTRFVGSGEVYDATLQFETSDQAQLVRLSVRFMYPHPYPIRPVPSPIERREKIIHPEKITFTPSPGVGLFTETSDHLHWIDRDHLYFLNVEPRISMNQLEELVGSFVQR